MFEGNVIDYKGIVIDYNDNFFFKKVIKLELDTEASIIICNDFIQFFGPSKNKVFEIIVHEDIRNINLHKKLS